jgi:hypothetical protein
MDLNELNEGLRASGLNPIFIGFEEKDQPEGDVVNRCPQCGKPNQFGELCPVCVDRKKIGQRNEAALRILGDIIKKQKGKVMCQTCGQKTRTKGDDGFCSKCIEENKPLLKTATVSGRCYDDGFIIALEDALKQFGLSVTSHPSWDGSDELGLIISNRPLSQDEIKAEQEATEQRD